MPDPYICYKYRPLENIGDKSKVEDIVKKHRLWFSSPAKFNDPHDCMPHMALPESDEKLAGLMQPTLDAIKEKHGIDEDIDMSELLEGMRQDSSAISRLTMEQSLAVLCMSLTAENPQQWAYYGASYYGICLGIDMSFLPLEEYLEVSYEDERIMIELETVSGDRQAVVRAFMAAVSRKHTNWQHEKEVRFFKEQENSNGYPFPPEALQEIYFGYQCTDMNIDYIDRICKASCCDPTFGYVEPNSEDFSLNVYTDMSASEVKRALQESRTQRERVRSSIPSLR